MAVPRRQAPKTAVLVAAMALAAMGCSSRDKASARNRRADAGAAAPAPAQAAPPPADELPETARGTPPAGRHGGVLRVHLEAEPPHLNPLLEGHQVIQRVVTGLVLETLVECRSDGYRPGLADRWEESSDGLRLQLHLRPGARWHDGRPVGPADVQASIEPLLRSSSRQPALRALLSDIEAVEVMADRVVRLRLARPSRLALRALCEVPILPAEAASTRATQNAQVGRLPIGTGPFRVAAWERGKRIRLVRQGPPGEGPPYLDEISFEIDGDGARALARARRGELHVLPRVLEVHYPDQVSSAALREVVSLYRLTPDRFSFLVVNHRRAVLADARVRRALASLWNRVRLADEVHRGLARPIGAPFGAPPPLPFDRAAAQQLLDEAGYRDVDGDGVRERAGVPIRLSLLQVSGSRAAATEGKAFAAELRRAGLVLELITVDAATLLARLKQGDFDLAPMIWEGRPDDDPRILFGPQGELAFSGYRSTALDGLLDRLRLADGPLARAPLLQQLGALLALEQPVIALYRHDVAALVSRRVHGLAGSGDRLDLRSVWLDP
jgi:peptide/nickel transport system substrate-binding protein